MAANSADFSDVFAALKKILKASSKGMTVVIDSDINYYLDTTFIQKNKKPMYFGSTNIKKNAVSFYLMPVYCHPELVEGISDDLQKRRQGKSCFNFSSVDPVLFKELKTLVQASRQQFVEAGYIPA